MVDYDLRPCDNHVNITDSSSVNFHYNMLTSMITVTDSYVNKEDQLEKEIFAFKAMLGTYNNLLSLKAVNCEA